MKLRVPFRRIAHHSGQSCPRCGSPAPEGLVLDASGGAACLLCTILLCLGQHELAVRCPEVTPRALTGTAERVAIPNEW